jgi:hypothetical protein
MFIRMKSGAKYNDEKKDLSSRIDNDPIEILVMWMEANGMQSLREYVNQKFLNKFIAKTLEHSQSLTSRMF